MKQKTVELKDWILYELRNIKEQSKSNKHKVGALVLSNDFEILSYGCNKSIVHSSNNCEIDNTTLLETTHAEENAVIQALINKTNKIGSKIVITDFPCVNCLRLIIQSGIKEIYVTNEFKEDHYSEFIEKQNDYKSLFDICSELNISIYLQKQDNLFYKVNYMSESTNVLIFEQNDIDDFICRYLFEKYFPINIQERSNCNRRYWKGNEHVYFVNCFPTESWIKEINEKYPNIKISVFSNNPNSSNLQVYKLHYNCDMTTPDICIKYLESIGIKVNKNLLKLIKITNESNLDSMSNDAINVLEYLKTFTFSSYIIFEDLFDRISVKPEILERITEIGYYLKVKREAEALNILNNFKLKTNSDNTLIQLLFEGSLNYYNEKYLERTFSDKTNDKKPNIRIVSFKFNLKENTITFAIKSIMRNPNKAHSAKYLAEIHGGYGNDESASFTLDYSEGLIFIKNF